MEPLFADFVMFMPSTSLRLMNVARCSSNRNAAALIFLDAAAQRSMSGERGFPDPGWTENQRAGAHRQAVAQQGIHCCDTTFQGAARERAHLAPVFQARKHKKPARLNLEVVEPAHISHTAQLGNLQPPPDQTEVHNLLLEADHAVGQALDVRVQIVPGVLVQQEQRTVPPDEELLQAQNLPPITERVAREQPHIGHRVQHGTRRLASLNGFEHVLRQVTQLDFGRMEERVFLFRAKILRGLEFLNVDAVKGPAVRRGVGP